MEQVLVNKISVDGCIDTVGQIRFCDSANSYNAGEHHNMTIGQVNAWLKEWHRRGEYGSWVQYSCTEKKKEN